ncbi:hypothetical protein Vadar_021668 [Vaccinium darrowii]|uniref:Uncharacterized protein n=1 Tax=Vaccinium darrowii TaxID=229202 RepID=A0ACB7Y9B4_9ERIC|nr:hypothetical protein Vadar_021668 [Vaccinium darrowii]
MGSLLPPENCPSLFIFSLSPILQVFPQLLTYNTPEDFVAKVRLAMTNEPQPLTPEQRYDLSWEAQRFMEYSELDRVLNINDIEFDSLSSQNNG